MLGAVTLISFLDGAVFMLLLLSLSAGGEGWEVTAVMMATLLPPILLAPALGAMVDRMPGRLAWVISLIMCTITTALLAVLAGSMIMVVVAGIKACFTSVAGSAVFKLLPTVGGLTTDRASALAVTIGSITGIVAPPLAAFGFGLGHFWVLAICAALYLVAALLVAFCLNSSERVEVEQMSLTEILLGTRSLRHLKSFVKFMPLMFGVVIATSMEAVAGVFYLQEVAGGPVMYGVLLAAWALGSLAGATSKLLNVIPTSPTGSIALGGLGISLALLVEGLIPSAVVILIAFLLGGLANSLHNIGVRDIVYEHVPPNLRGQAWAFVGAMFASGEALGNLLGTPNLFASERNIVIAAGAIGTVIALATTVYFARSLGIARKAQTASE